MWLPTDIRRRSVSFLLLLFFALTLSGCGYTLGADTPSVLTPVEAENIPSLKIRNIDNPTLFPWLTYAVRTQLRDEIAARNIARWVDSGPADYEISLKVDRYTYRSWQSRTDYTAMLYSAQIIMNATVYKGNSATVVWNGWQSYSQTFERVQEESAANALVREIIRRLTVNMRQKF